MKAVLDIDIELTVNTYDRYKLRA